MSEEIEIAGIKVPKADWEATPASIRALVVVLSERLKQQDERLNQLEEKLNQTSKNSSTPPSSDGFGQSSVGKKKGKSANRLKKEPVHPLVRPVSSSPAKPVTRCKRWCLQCAKPVVHHLGGMIAAPIGIKR